MLRSLLHPPRLIGTGMILTAGTVIGSLLEARRLRFLDARLWLPRFAQETPALRIAFLTDFHVGGPGFGAQLTRTGLRSLLAWQPDLVLLGGDYFDQGRLVCTDAFDLLASFERVYAVLGNHDHRRGSERAAAITRFLRERGVQVLRNERRMLDIPRADGSTVSVELIGLDDPYTGLADRQLLAHPPGPAMRILLVHTPSILEQLPLGCADLLLCGHTHWGQVRLSRSPYLTALDAARYLDRWRRKPHSRLQRGWFWVNGVLAYVSSGLGTTQLPLRFFAPPELVRLELGPASPDCRWPCDDPRFYVRMAYSR